MWHLIAVFISGLTLGGLAYLARKLSRNKLPAWIVPIAAGLSMFGYLAFYDYTWYEHKTAQIRLTEPNPELLIFDEIRGTSFFKPWSFLHPAVNRFFVFDGKHVVSEQDSETIVEYFLYEFIKDPIERQQHYRVIMNCTQLDRVLSARTSVRHEEFTHDDLLYKTLCR